MSNEGPTLKDHVVMLLSDDQSALAQAIDHMAANNFFGEDDEEFGPLPPGTEVPITEKGMAQAIELMAMTYLSLSGIAHYGDDPNIPTPPPLDGRGFH